MREPYHGTENDITPDELARQLGVTGLNVRNWLRAHYGKLPNPYRFGWRIPADDVARLKRHFGGR